MSLLLQEIEEEFDPGVLERGREYFQQGLVQISKITAARVTAQVAGSRNYKVQIEQADGYVDYSCTCPYFADHGFGCKHIWATLCAAEAQGWAALADEDGDFEPIAVNFLPRRAAPKRSKAASDSAWKQKLSQWRDRIRYGGGEPPPPRPWPQQRQIIYAIVAPSYAESSAGVEVEVLVQEPRKDGSLGKLKRAAMTPWEWNSAPDPVDRAIGQLMFGTTRYTAYYGNNSDNYRFTVAAWAYPTTLKMIGSTGRCVFRRDPQAPPEPVVWDDADPWEFTLSISEQSNHRYQLAGLLRRVDEEMSLNEPVFLIKDLLIARGKVSRLTANGAFEMLRDLRATGEIVVPRKSAVMLMEALYALPHLPSIRWPKSLAPSEIRAIPNPALRIKSRRGKQDRLSAELLFDYDGRLAPHDVDQGSTAAVIIDAKQRQVLIRDTTFEKDALNRLFALGFRQEWDYYGGGKKLRLPPQHLPRVVRELAAENWRIEADGKLYRRPGEISISVSTGIDWFDLTGTVDFGGALAPFPKLLAALAQRESFVTLDDGTLGILPEDFLAKYAALAGLGQPTGDRLRFTRAQAGFLDGLLASLPDSLVDEPFHNARRQLRNFSGVAPADPPQSFAGTLRPYQREGLGWLRFLEQFGFGGCLADDMGLGKTIQVLALLEGRRLDKRGPSLVVAPRSLVFNWKREAERFTPHLRVLDQTGPDRVRDTSHLRDYDLVLTTYGTLRTDVGYFKDFTFDYAVLDEAQAIKNASTQCAKASRLIRANNRLALSGTPVENRLADLWSIFEFLNPRMLGSAQVFKSLLSSDGPEGRQTLAAALRPFILRRTKQQVAPELPDKLEQTVFCELDPRQRKLYDELRDHYRQSLLTRITRDGLNKSKIQVLEALLRLRQAACHPALIDRKHRTHNSTKLDALLQQLGDVLDEGHKALVFSQFTSLLAILKKQLDEKKVPYEYLDGQTRDRQQRVDRFQRDSDCKLFLISLKAGGVGLNLTAAEYVFLLDPWWNPAVESQAIDRAHRIGQDKRVFAYRLIAKDTVEEKVLQLQQSKRALADAIINEDNSLIASMGRAELELLLS